MKNIEVDKISQDVRKAVRDLCRHSGSYFGVNSGCVSMRIQQNTFLINKKFSIFNEIDLDSMIFLNTKMESRWNEANEQCDICASIFNQFSEAKFVLFARARYAIAASLKNDIFYPQDVNGCNLFGREINILDAKDLETWDERKVAEVMRFLRANNSPFVFVKGCGIYAYGRDLLEVANYIITLEESARISVLASK